MNRGKSRRLHFKDLYAMRFLAILGVFAFHSFPFADRGASNSLWAAFLRFTDGWGLAGVDFFFLLSGFLMAVHGLREYKYFDKFDLKAFLIRRTLRILPLYLILLLLGFVIVPSLLQGLKMNPIETPDWWPYLLFYANFDVGLGNTDFVNFMLMPAALLIFLQLYLIMGIVMKYFRPQLSIVLNLLIIIGLSFRVYDLYSEVNFTYTPFYYLCNIGIGMHLARFVRNRGIWFQNLRSKNKNQVKTLYIISCIFIFLGYSLTKTSILQVFISIPVLLAFAYLIFDQSFGLNSPFQLKKIKFMSEWGKLSYGIYMYQGITVSLLVILWETLEIPTAFFLEQVMFPIVALSLTIFVAKISFWALEKPILRIRREFKKT